MSKIISRKDFLKGAALVLGTELAEACAPKPLKPSNLIHTLTQEPTISQESTIVPEPTSEPLPSIEAKEWAVNEETGLIDPDKLYPYVGDWILTTPQGQQLDSSKNRAVDLMWENIRLVYVGDKDVQEKGFYQKAYRTDIAEQLNNNAELKWKLSEIKDKLPSQDLTPTLMTIVINGPDFSNNTANLIAGANETNPVVTGIAANLGATPKWYRIEETDRMDLVRLDSEQEPMLLPPLKVEGGRYIRTDSGEGVMMRGMNYGVFQQRRLGWDASAYVADLAFKELKDAGGNFLVISLKRDAIENQSAQYFLRLSEHLKLARKYGIRTMLTIGWLNDKEMIRVVDEQVAQDWKSLVNFTDETNPFIAGQNFAALLRKTVDVFQMISEPQGDFSVFNPNLDNACGEIRSQVGSEAICGFSNGCWFATGAVELIGRESEWVQTHPQSTVVIHPFILDNPVDLNNPLNSQRPDPMLYLKELKEKGVLVTVGESGWTDWNDHYDWLMKFYQYLGENKISYATDGDVSQLRQFWKQFKNN
jgi:hypothetical protein